uniref:BTB domain-containing protein n=1 Tax=Ciona savignyi TaxID=51511 RepID=H2ZIH9_CIOSA
NFPPIIPEKHRIVFNAAGKLFEADQRLLDKYPETVLGGHKSRMRFYDLKKNEYFFDRHREVFEAVLQFYTNGGTLARPSHIPLDIFVNEIRFYSFDYETIENFLRDEGLLLIEKKKPLPNGKIRRIIWRLFEDTEYSWCSKVVTLISALVITISVVVFCLETRPAFTSLSNNVTEQIRPSLEACQRSLNGQHSASPAGILFLTETSCIVWFVLELGLRFGTCPDRKAFCKSFLNIVDASAILPYFITMIVISIENSSHLRPQTATILRTIRLVRMLRILKLSRYSRGFRILGLTLIRSTRVLFLLVCFQMVLAIVFSSVVYFVEYDAPGTQFTSIPDSFWWALITMTTVGYGDVVPITVLGKIAGASCAIMGILCISFPVPVIVSNFNYLYNRD